MFFTLSVALVVPVFVFAATFFDDTEDLIGDAGDVVNTLLWVVSAMAVLAFFWGIVKYVAAAGDESAAKKGKSIMIYGAVALFVLFSIFGIIRFLQVEFGLFGPSAMYNPQVIQQGSTPGGQ